MLNETIYVAAVVFFSPIVFLVAFAISDWRRRRRWKEGASLRQVPEASATAIHFRKAS